jgi:hypothetical protein
MANLNNYARKKAEVDKEKVKIRKEADALIQKIFRESKKPQTDYQVIAKMVSDLKMRLDKIVD